jgi:hypothetical protein
MSKYNIEGGVDFFSELYKSLDDEVSEEKTEEDNNKCLITNQKLTDKHIIMDCGHKFNYIPLFNDIMNHKKIFNCLEGANKLKMNEIRCPYCRKKHENVLPYYEELCVGKVNGVNFYDPNCNAVVYKCEYRCLNPNYDQFKPESETNSKYDSCCVSGCSKILLYNADNPSDPVTHQDTNYYCFKHKKEMIKKYKLQQKNKKKKEKEEAKIVEKQTKLLEKQNAKALVKAEKLKAKEEAKAAKKKPISENVVLGLLTVENQTIEQIGCVQILKTGTNKGNQCGCKIVSENMCKRHYLLNHKELITHN